MKQNMRKEIKIGILLFAIFNILNVVRIQIGTEIPVLHIFLGVLAGLGFVAIFIGILPESIYLKVKNFKKNHNPFM